ncbi:DoxX family protein [Dyadobacter helix]|nr:hypothetical protein [Dyadobacter sp. CECT 9275]
MKPFIVLIVAFGLSLLGTKFMMGNFEFAFSGRIAMSVMLIFTAFAHFAFTKGMAMMLPDFVPYKIEMVYLTGIMEIAFAIGLLIPGIRVMVAWLLILFLIIVLPANIYASVKQINYQNGSFDGNGLAYLWFRIPLQILFIVWTYLSSVNA